MDEAPGYLMGALKAASLGLSDAFAGEISEEPLIAATEEVAAHFSEWAADEDFWATTSAAFRPDALSGVDPGEMFDEEVEILTKVLGGDRATAVAVVIELVASGQSARIATPDAARKAVERAASEGREAAAGQPGPPRFWRAVRFLRRSVTLVAGGLGIAADVVSPDPTLLTKAASIAAGLGAILSTAPSGGG